MTPDSSVLVAALASWHPRHDQARAALESVHQVVAHVLIETFSVLTRLPAPHRISAADASSALGALPWRVIQPTPRDVSVLVAEAGSRGLSGGAIYDAVIALTARRHHLTLVTSDRRAARTYEAMRCQVRQL